MGSRRRKVGIAVAFHVGGIDGVRKYLRRKYRFAFPSYWIGAARTHPIRAFALASWVVWWKELGNGITAFWFTIPTVIVGVSAWYWYRYKKTGLSMKEAATQLRLQKRVEERWVKVCKAAGISVANKDGGVTVPPLKKLQIENGDVTARAYPGQYAIATKDVTKNLERIANTVGCHQVTLVSPRPGEVRLRFCFSDPFSKIVEPTDIQPIRKGAAPYGITDNGETIGLSVVKKTGEVDFTPVLIGGVTGAGKSSAVWAILDGFIIQKIPVCLWVIDPAGGVEMAALGEAYRDGLGTDLFRVYRYISNPDDAPAMLKEFKAAMDERLAAMVVNRVREHTPTVEEPMHILICDELLQMGDTMLKGGVHSPFGKVMSAGRKAGFSTICLTQMGHASVIGNLRELFKRRICFATETREQTDTILGSGKSDLAPAHTISERTPGVGFAFADGTRGLTQFRAVYFNNGQIQQIAMGEVPTGMGHLVDAPPPEDVPRAVYWHYGYPDPQTGGRKLWYVGSASDPKERFKEHAKDRKSRRWWNKTDHSARRIEWYPTQAEGYAAEWAAIDRDQPLYNDKGNRDNPARLTDEPAADEVAA